MAGVQVVGREAEREAIARWLDLERPATLSIDGEAGIGKSTLWSFAVALAIERGDRVLSWRASTAERELAFAALNALFDGPSVADVIERLPEPRRRALQAALGLIEPALQPAEPMLVGSAVADTLKALAAAAAESHKCHRSCDFRYGGLPCPARAGHMTGAPAGRMDPVEAPAMRLSEVARRLAISRAAAYRLVRSGALRGIHVGETWRVLRVDFEAYLDDQRADAERRYRQARDEP